MEDRTRGLKKEVVGQGLCIQNEVERQLKRDVGCRGVLNTVPNHVFNFKMTCVEASLLQSGLSTWPGLPRQSASWPQLAFSRSSGRLLEEDADGRASRMSENGQWDAGCRGR
jgi:hypothetical protein